MNQKIIDYTVKGLIFIGGFVAGAITCNTVVKKRYESRIEQEIADMKKEVKKAKENTGLNIEARCPKEVVDFVKGIDLTNPPALEKEEEDEEEPAYDITMSEFGELPDYNVCTLYYYTKSNVLADEEDNVVDNIDEIIGKKIMEAMIDSEDVDSIYVRNDNKKCDYEIIKSAEDFSDYAYNNDWDDDDG